MSEEEIDRKITVIFTTDVVGYSKHMEADESGTVKNLRACEKLLTGLFQKLAAVRLLRYCSHIFFKKVFILFDNFQPSKLEQLYPSCSRFKSAQVFPTAIAS